MEVYAIFGENHVIRYINTGMGRLPVLKKQDHIAEPGRILCLAIKA